MSTYSIMLCDSTIKNRVGPTLSSVVDLDYESETCELACFAHSICTDQLLILVDVLNLLTIIVLTSKRIKIGDFILMLVEKA